MPYNRVMVPWKITCRPPAEKLHASWWQEQSGGQQTRDKKLVTLPYESSEKVQDEEKCMY